MQSEDSQLSVLSGGKKDQGKKRIRQKYRNKDGQKQSRKSLNQMGFRSESSDDEDSKYISNRKQGGLELNLQDLEVKNKNSIQQKKVGYEDWQNVDVDNKISIDKNLIGEQGREKEGGSQKSEANKDGFTKFIQKLRLRSIAIKFANKTRARMIKKLTNFHYYLMDDFKPETIGLSQVSERDLQKQINFRQLKKFKNQVQKFILNRFQILANRLVQGIISLSDKVPTFHPSKLYCLLIEILFLFVKLYLSFIVSISLGLKLNLNSLISDENLDFILIISYIDLVYRSNLGFFEKGKLIFQRNQILKQYLKIQFWKDFLSLLTVQIFRNAGPEQTARFIQISYPIISLLGMNIYKRIEERWLLGPTIRNILNFIKLFIFIIVVNHFFACLWAFVGKIQIYESDNWLQRAGVENFEWTSQYLRSFYFITVTMITVGYGDILPQNDLEILTCIFTMLIGCGVFAYSVNNIGTIIQDFFKEEEEIKSKLYIINKYMKRKNVNQEMQYSIREYLQYYWKESNYDEDNQVEQILSQLSEKIREQLLFEANQLVLRDSKIFHQNFSSLLIKKTVPLIKQQTYAPDQIIFNQKENADDNCIYFIESGIVEIFLKTKHGRKILCTLKKGDTFGAYSFFTENEREVSAVCKEFAVILFVQRREFLNLSKDFTEDYEKFCHIQDSLRINNDVKKIDELCKSCKQNYHLTHRCSYFNSNYDKRTLIRKQSREVQQRQPQSGERALLKENVWVNLMDIQEIQEYFLEENQKLCKEYEIFVKNDLDFQLFQRKIENIIIPLKQDIRSIIPIMQEDQKVLAQNQFSSQLSISNNNATPLQRLSSSQQNFFSQNEIPLKSSQELNLQKSSENISSLRMIEEQTSEKNYKKAAGGQKKQIQFQAKSQFQRQSSNNQRKKQYNSKSPEESEINEEKVQYFSQREINQDSVHISTPSSQKRKENQDYNYQPIRESKKQPSISVESSQNEKDSQFQDEELDQVDNIFPKQNTGEFKNQPDQKRRRRYSINPFLRSKNRENSFLFSIEKSNSIDLQNEKEKNKKTQFQKNDNSVNNSQATINSPNQNKINRQTAQNDQDNIKNQLNVLMKEIKTLTKFQSRQTLINQSSLNQNKQYNNLMNTFENLKNYQIYFPHNNIQNIIHQIKGEAQQNQILPQNNNERRNGSIRSKYTINKQESKAYTFQNKSFQSSIHKVNQQISLQESDSISVLNNSIKHNSFNSYSNVQVENNESSKRNLPCSSSIAQKQNQISGYFDNIEQI